MNADPLELLDQAEISYSNKDRLQVNGRDIDPKQELEYNGAYTIAIKHAVKIQIIDGEKNETITSSADTLGQALELPLLPWLMVIGSANPLIHLLKRI